MAFRSARENADDDSGDSSSSYGSRSSGRNTGGGASAPATPAELVDQLGMQPPNRDAFYALRRKSKRYGTDTVSQWVGEGMALGTMGDPAEMEAFRERQAQRPPEVPADVERQNEQSLHRSRKAQRDTGAVGDGGVPDSVRDVVTSPGTKLPGEVKSGLEDSLGTTLDQVQVHTGPRAQQACEQVNARAFTVGNHIAFGPGEFDPSSSEGQHLIAHEVVHTLQQPDAAMSMMPKADLDLKVDPDQAAEREAKKIAGEVMKGGDVGMESAWQMPVHVQRMETDDVLPALALFDLENDSKSGWEAGEFQQRQNQERIQFLKDSIKEHGAEVNELAEKVHAEDSTEMFKNNVEALGGEVQEDGSILIPDDAPLSADHIDREWVEANFGVELDDETDIEAELTRIKNSLAEDAEQVALTDSQRDEIESGFDTGMIDDIGTPLLSLVLGTAAPALAVFAASVGWNVAKRKWQNLDGDIAERAAELQDELLEEIVDEEYHGGDSTGDAQSRR